MARYTIDFYAKSLFRRINIEVIIPSLNLHGSIQNNDVTFYQKQITQFPLIMFLCGFGENQLSWQNHTHVDELLEKNQVAGVFLNGENKWYLNQGPIENWDNFIEHDLIDFLYGHFRNLSSEMPLVIAGNSMGGYGALYHYIKYPNKYSACISLSPALKPDGGQFDSESLENILKLKNESVTNVYLSIGEKDFIIEESKKFNQFLEENHFGISYRYVPEYDHSWNFWRYEIDNIFTYLKQLGFIGVAKI